MTGYKPSKQPGPIKPPNQSPAPRIPFPQLLHSGGESLRIPLVLRQILQVFQGSRCYVIRSAGGFEQVSVDAFPEDSFFTGQLFHFLNMRLPRGFCFLHLPFFFLDANQCLHVGKGGTGRGRLFFRGSECLQAF